MTEQPVVYLVATGAPPVRQLAEPLALLQDADWQACAVLSPAAASWIDAAELQATAGCPVRLRPRRPDEPDALPLADAVLAAPMTFNSINKVAGGIGDTFATSLLNELLGIGVPMVFAPCVKQPLRAHPAYRPNVERLRTCGVHLLDPDDITGRGPDGLAAFDWSTVVSRFADINR